MKKILLATTVLVGTAGFAAAEVTLSGDARMGITNNNTARDAAFSSRARVAFTLSGETDGGLSFGASFRADNAATRIVPDASTSDAATDADDVYDTAGGANEGRAGAVFISGAFGKLSIGDNDSAAQAGVGHVAGVGYTGLGDLNEVDYLSDGTSSALYAYSAGDLTVMASTGPLEGESQLSLAAAYTMGDYTIAGGVESHDDEGTHVIFGASAKFGGVSVKAIYGALEDDNQYAVSGTYTAGAVSATAFHRMDLGTDSTANGVGVAYDLGGGAAVAAGMAKEEGADSIYDAGVTFSF